MRDVHIYSLLCCVFLVYLWGHSKGMGNHMPLVLLAEGLELTPQGSRGIWRENISTKRHPLAVPSGVCEKGTRT